MNTDCINLIDIVVFMLTSVVHQVFIHMSIIWICVVSSVHLASRQKLCVTKTLMLNMPGKSFNHIFLIPAMLICIIDFYHFMPLPLTLTLPGDEKISAKENLLASFSPETIFEQDLLKQGKELLFY